MATLREIRKQLGLTQVEAARGLNVSRRTLQKYEKLDEDPENDDDSITMEYLCNKILEMVQVDEIHGFVTLHQIKQAAKGVFEKHPQVQVAYLFGSYARGEQTIKSDVDIFVVIEGHMGMEYFGMSEELKDILNKNIDLVSLNQVVGSEDFLKRLLREGVKIYGPRTHEITS